MIENKIAKDKNLLVVLPGAAGPELDHLVQHFCGQVLNTLPETEATGNQRLYVCGDLSQVVLGDRQAFVIQELSGHYEGLTMQGRVQVVTLGQVPVIVHNAGVYFRRLFGEDDYFTRIRSEHTFQELTESTKESKSFRKGIYLTDIVKEETGDSGEALHFRLLRCSSNLTGPTDNFRFTDREIVDRLNDAARYVFAEETTLNHVLAQIYENKKNENQKEVKARIKAHSDKTKDMPKEGLIAFCTFYDMSTAGQVKPSTTDRYDWCYKDTSVLTNLHFKLKSSVNDDTLSKEFSVRLYPNSAFIIPLSTNRLYTHEIRPSTLGIDRIPTRMGYVVRCSNVEAVFVNDQTFIREDSRLLPLEKMTPDMLEDLRNSYYVENTSESRVDYGEVRFSMNSGDYEKPIY